MTEFSETLSPKLPELSNKCIFLIWDIVSVHLKLSLMGFVIHQWSTDVQFRHTRGFLKPETKGSSWITVFYPHIIEASRVN